MIGERKMRRRSRDGSGGSVSKVLPGQAGAHFLNPGSESGVAQRGVDP